MYKGRNLVKIFIKFSQNFAIFSFLKVRILKNPNDSTGHSLYIPTEDSQPGDTVLIVQGHVKIVVGQSD